MNGRGNLIVVIIFIIALIACLYGVVTMRMRLNDLLEQKEEMQRQLDDYEDDVARLQYELEQPMDDEYMMRIARERLGYHLPDEKVFYYSKGN